MQRLHQVIWYLTLFCVPISIPKEIGGGFTVSFPSEILIVLCGILGFLSDSPAQKTFSVFRSPLTWAILADFGVMFLTTLSSVQPEISAKRLIVKALFLWVFYFQAAHRFQSEKELLRFWYAYIAGMSLSIVFILIQHGQYQFAANVAADIPKPLFAEHAIYGACLAFVLPFLAIRWIKGSLFGKRNAIWGILLLLFLFAEYAAASRAAWIGLILAVPIFFLLIFRIKIWQMFLICGIFALLIGLNQETIASYIQQNKAESHNRTSNVIEHISSITNLQTDVSNLERLNRWGAAWRMIQDKPILGFGPGTYQFNYAGYQVFSELTRISTRNGDKGNAHSEYIMAWVETGIFGLFTFILILGIAVFMGIKKAYTLQNERLKYLKIAALLGLTTFIIHGGFNAFLDQDEAATLVWATMAMFLPKYS